MMTVTQTIGISEVEFNALRERAKTELKGVTFSMRYHGRSGAKYAYGSFDLRPTKATRHTFSDADTVRVMEWLRGQGFYVQPYEYERVVYRAGFSYIRKVA